MNTSLNILFFIWFISIVIHILSLAIVAFFIIPLQIKEAQVKDGLLKLRQQLLLFGIDIVVVGFVTIASLGIRFFIFDLQVLRYAIVILVFIHAIGFLGFSVIGYSMYTSQYTDEIKEAHKIAEKIEDKKAKDNP